MAANQFGETGSRGILERLFKLSEHGTTVRTELLAGLTTFVTMAYIIVVNPSILKLTGMDEGALFMATILSAAAATLVMGFFANWPFALAPGMGLNAFFTFAMVGAMGVPWQTALGAVFISGTLMMLITMTGLRAIVVKAIPQTLKHAAGAGIGLFVMLIGFKNAGIVMGSEATIITLGNIKSAPVLLALIGLVLTAILVARKVPGGILIGIAVTTLLGIPMGVTHLPTTFVSAPPSLAPNLLTLAGLTSAFKVSLIPVIFSLFFSDMFDTLGTFVGVAGKAGLLDKEGNMKGDGRALFADAFGTIAGAVMGTSNVTTYVESTAGIAAGGRTGLTAVTTAVLFLLAMFFAPLALAVPEQATAPALIIVGILMASALLEVDLHDFTEAVPAIITAVMMPFTFSIATGLALGFIAYVILNLATGRAAKIHWMMYGLSAFFLYYFYAH